MKYTNFTACNKDDHRFSNNAVQQKRVSVAPETRRVLKYRNLLLSRIRGLSLRFQAEDGAEVAVRQIIKVSVHDRNDEQSQERR